MGDILFIVLRRLRAPLIALIVIYAVAIAGMVAIPGVDAQGRVWHVSFFHAFYVVSYTATTIGFGEIPYPFTDAQRLWVIAVIYLSVIGWAYALGTVFALSRDPVFRAAAARSFFVRRVAHLSEPYCVVCGYGRSGQEIVKALDALRVRVVIVDIDAGRLDPVAVQPFLRVPLVRTGDARRPEVLRDAGIARPECRAIIAITGDDEANQAIALGARALDPSTLIIARVTDPVIVANLAEFGGIQVIDPYRTFADNLRLGVAAPEVLQLEEWLTASPGSERPATLRLPDGHWVLVGTDRFIAPIAQALAACGQTSQALTELGLPHAVTASTPVAPGTEDSLLGAGIDRAVGLVAATDSDTANLAVVAMARRVNPVLTVVMRQNKAYNRLLVDASQPALTFVQSNVMVHEVLQALTTPLLDRFLDQLRHADPALAREASVRLEAAVGTLAPAVWTFECDADKPGLTGALQDADRPLTIAELMIDPRDGQTPLRVVPLMRVRRTVSAWPPQAVASRRGRGWSAGEPLLRHASPAPGSRLGWPVSDADLLQILPDPATALAAGDAVLFAGAEDVERLQERFAWDSGLIAFVRNGVEPPRSAVFRWLAARRARAAAPVSPRP